jgi:hypothetical protein
VKCGAFTESSRGNNSVADGTVKCRKFSNVEIEGPGIEWE